MLERMKQPLVMLGLVAAWGVAGCETENSQRWGRSSGPQPIIRWQPEAELSKPADLDAQPVVMEAVAQPENQVTPLNSHMRTYTVVRHDTLWSIAKREYGNGHRWKDIVSANPGLDPNKMRVGQQILLP